MAAVALADADVTPDRHTSRPMRRPAWELIRPARWWAQGGACEGKGRRPGGLQLDSRRGTLERREQRRACGVESEGGRWYEARRREGEGGRWRESPWLTICLASFVLVLVLVLAAPVNGGPTQLLGSAHQVVLLGWSGQLGLLGTRWGLRGLWGGI